MLLAGGASAYAQSVDQADLERCANEDTRDRKLACFEALTNAGSRVSATTPAVLTVPAKEAAVEAADPAAAPALQVEAMETPDTLPASVSFNGMPAEAELKQAESVSLPTQTVASPLSGTGVRDSVEEVPDKMMATVMQVTKGRFDILSFHFANGEVWRQAQARRFRYPKDREFEVSISTGMMGDYQLRVEDSGPMTRVRRIK